MIAGLFPLVFVAAMVFLLLKSFQLMAIAAGKGATTTRTPTDRTGLKTTHPELIDENGDVTTEELWAVRFSDLDDYMKAGVNS